MATKPIPRVGTRQPSYAVRDEVARLKARISRLEKEVRALKAFNGSGRAAVLRTVNKEQARAEIIRLLDQGNTLYMSEIADRLRLPDRLVVEICNDLRQQGRVRVDDNALRSG